MGGAEQFSSVQEGEIQCIPSPRSEQSTALLLAAGLGLLAACGSDSAGADITPDPPAPTPEPPTTPEAPTTTQPAPPPPPVEPETTTVNLTVDLVSYDYCYDLAASETWSDIPFSQVDVTDGNGNLLGFTNLDDGLDTDNACRFTATFDVDVPEDGLYQIQVGAYEGDSIAYSETDVRLDGLTANITFNDNNADGVPDDYVEPAPEPTPAPGANWWYDGNFSEADWTMAHEIWQQMPQGSMYNGGDGCTEYLDTVTTYEQIAQWANDTFALDGDAYLNVLDEFCVEPNTDPAAEWWFDGNFDTAALEAAEDVWMSLPTGEDGCTEFLDTTTTYEDIARKFFIGWGVDGDAYLDVLSQHCGS